MQLFQHSETPCHNIPSEKPFAKVGKNQKAQQRLQFRLDFPLLTSCIKDGTKTNCPSFCLPPSFAINLSHLKAKAFYRIRAVVRRKGLLRPRLVRYQNVEFKPLNAPDIEQTEPALVSSRTVSFGGALDSFAMDLGNAGHSWLPEYHPSIILRVDMPLPCRLRPGHCIDVEASISVPRAFAAALGGLWLTNITTRLRSLVHINVNMASNEKVICTDLCTFSDLLPVEFDAENERFTIPSGIWKHHVVPDGVPSFCACAIELAHELEVRIRLRSGRGGIYVSCCPADTSCIRRWVLALMMA
jgi:hypothetical protein